MALDLSGFGLRESDIYYALGLYFASNRRDPIRAIPCLEKVLQTAPKHSFALFRLMHQYRDRFRKLGDLEDLKRAEEKADVLHQIEPTFANCLECSDIYLYVEKFDKAAACYEKALEIREEDYRGYNGLGLVAMDRKEYEIGRASCRERV